MYIYIYFKIPGRKNKGFCRIFNVHIHCIFIRYIPNMQIDILYGGLIYMETVRGKVATLQRLNWRLIRKVAPLVVIAALVIWVCISTSNTSDMQQKYASSRSAVGEALYGCASMLALEYDDADFAGADIEGEILPQMRIYYAQVQALNNAMASAYGSHYAVFDPTLIQDISLAFDEYEAAFAMGHSTDDAHARMTESMTRVRQVLNDRFDENAQLK